MEMEERMAMRKIATISIKTYMISCIVLCLTALIAGRCTWLYSKMESSYVTLIAMNGAWGEETGISKVDRTYGLLFSVNLRQIKKCKNSIGGNLVFWFFQKINTERALMIERDIERYENVPLGYGIQDGRTDTLMNGWKIEHRIE